MPTGADTNGTQFTFTPSAGNLVAQDLNGTLYTFGVSAIILPAGPLTNGQLIIGSTGVAPVAATLTQGATAGVTITNGAGSITLDTTQDIRTTANPSFNTVVSTQATGTAPFTVASTTQVANLNAATAGTATNATNVANTGAVSTNASFFPTFVAANTTSNQGVNTAAAFNFNPSTGVLSATSFTGAGTGLTGTAASLIVGNATASVTATNVAGGLQGTIVYQSAASTTAQLATGTSGQFLQTQGASANPQWTTAAYALSVQNPAADTVNAPNNTTTNFATSYTFAANAIATGTVHRITMNFKYIDSGGALTVSFKSTLGGTDACSFSSVSHGAAGTYLWNLIVYVIGTAAASGASSVIVMPSIGGNNLASSAPFSKGISSVPTNFATNGTLVYQPQFQASVNTAANSLQLLSMIVEKVA